VTAVVEPPAAAAVVRPPVYVGLVTRAIAFALDAAVINLVAIVVTALATLILSVITVPESLRAFAVAVGAIVYLAWVAGYFVVFWTTTGQTPGDRLLRFRVRPTKGVRLRPRAAVVRFVGLTLAALPLFAGYLIILVDDRRRGLHDRLAGTEVVEVADDEVTRADARRGRSTRR
jgi:uncharacterized RDD family membrane protein YckC